MRGDSERKEGGGEQERVWRKKKNDIRSENEE